MKSPEWKVEIHNPIGDLQKFPTSSRDPKVKVTLYGNWRYDWDLGEF